MISKKKMIKKYFRTILKQLEELHLMKNLPNWFLKLLGMIAKRKKPDVTTLYLDKLVPRFYKRSRWLSCIFRNVWFPNSLCISPNEEVVHGIPNDKPLKEGDVLSGRLWRLYE